MPAPIPNLPTFAALRAGPLNRTMLSGEFGTSWQVAMGSVQDDEFYRQIWARRARFPEWAPTDALTYLAGERGVENVLTMGTISVANPDGLREPEATWRTRLRECWEKVWAPAGSQDGHVAELGWTGLTTVSIHRRKEWSMPDDASAPSNYVRAFQRSMWAQFDTLIDKPNPWLPVKWGQAGLLWGGGWTWGSTATVAEIEQLRRLLRQFRAGHETPTWIVTNLSTGAKLWGGFFWNFGNWGGGATGSVVRWLVGEPHWRLRGLAP